MRTSLIALIPAALMASAAYAQEDTQPPADPAPTEKAAAQEGEAEKPAPPPVVQTSEVTGTWARTQESGRETVTYTSTDGETLFSASCMVADSDTGNRIVQIKAASAEDTVGAIDIFTSAGNARVAAGPDMSPDTAAGMIETVSQPTYVLASGAGEMRIVSGTRGIVFETDPMLKDVIRTCQSQQRAQMQAAQAEAQAAVEETEPEESELTADGETTGTSS